MPSEGRLLSHEPPRSTRDGPPPSEQADDVHSPTPPDMSMAPHHETSFGCVPTGHGPFHWRDPSGPALQHGSSVGFASPHTNGRPSTPRAANSHSASVGNRLPAKRQYASAASALMHAIGRSAAEGSAYVQPNTSALGATQDRSATHARYARTVTSVLSMQNDWTVTACAGGWPLGAGSIPILKAPPST